MVLLKDSVQEAQGQESVVLTLSYLAFFYIGIGKAIARKKEGE